MVDEGPLDYAAVSKLVGKSVGALRVMRSRGQLPDQDAPGPRWRRETLAAAGLLGAPVPEGVKLEAVAADRSAALQPRSDTGASPATPERSAAPVAAPAPSRPAFAGEDAEDRRRRSMTIADVLACPHPAEDRKVTPYMTMCVVCGRRMEGRDRWAGAGYAGWTPGWEAACPHPETERRRHPWVTQCGVCGKVVG